MAISTLQVANPSMGTVTREPQTTAQPPVSGGLPFPRLSRKMQILGPSQSGQAYGTQWSPLLKPVGGYLRSLVFAITSVTGGALTAGSLAADAPYNVIQNLYLRDPFGSSIYQVDGYGLYLINRYSGQVGSLGFGNDPTSLPSYAAPVVGTGAFTFYIQIPMELDSSGYCSLPMMNASSQPQIQVQLNPLTQVFGASVTGTPPTLALQLDEYFWGAPVDNPQAAPADVGSSHQWTKVSAAQGVNSLTYQRIQLPQAGSYITTLILELRDTTNIRIDAWPTTDLALWIDGVCVSMETLNERQDTMYRQFAQIRPTGVIVFSYRDSIQTFVSTGDTYDLLLPTTPATLVEIAGTFGTITNAPGKIYATMGALYPLGGIPYTHLAA